MPSNLPTEAELVSLAERALRRAGAEAQVTAAWERSLAVEAPPERRLRQADALVVEVVAIREGRVGRASTTATDDEGLRRVAEGAARAAELAPVARAEARPHRVRAPDLAAQEGEDAEGRRRAAHAAVHAAELARAPDETGGAAPPVQPEPPPAAAPQLPDPLRGRSHDGWDPAVPELDPAAVAAELPHPDGAYSIRWWAGAARTAIASSRGVRAYEQRTCARIDVTVRRDDRVVSAGDVAVGHDRLDPRALMADLAGLLGEGEPASIQPHEHPTVLGHHAVAQVLELVKPHFGVLAAAGEGAIAGRLGQRIVAPCINLSDSPRFAATLPRSYDVEGVPRQPVPLLQDGVAHRVVHDTASAARAGTIPTGHASIPARLAPRPDHLVLVGGGASGVQELAAPIARGLYIPALAREDERGSGEPVFRTLGAFLIEDGERSRPLRELRVTLDPIDVLAATEALTSVQRLVVAGGAGGIRSPRLTGATVCPALRTAGGLRVLRIA